MRVIISLIFAILLKLPPKKSPADTEGTVPTGQECFVFIVIDCILMFVVYDNLCQALCLYVACPLDFTCMMCVQSTKGFAFASLQSFNNISEYSGNKEEIAFIMSNVCA